MAVSPIKITIAGVDKFSKNFMRVQKSLGKMQSMAKQTGQAFTRNVTLPVVAGIAASMKAGYDFSKAMNNIQAKTEAANPAMAKLREEIKGIGKDLNMSNKDLAKGGDFLAQANYSVVEISKNLPVLAKLAVATNTDIIRTSDIASNVLGGFGEDVKNTTKFATSFAYAAAKANTNLEQFGEAMVESAPNASILGFTMQEMSASVGVLGDAGIQATKVGTTLKNMTLKLAENADMLKEAGINILDANGNARGFRNIMADIGKKIAGMNVVDQAKAMDKLFGKRAIAGAKILIRDSMKADSKLQMMTDTMNGFTKAGKTNTASLDKMFATIRQGNVGKWDQILTDFQNMMIDISDSGAWDPIISGISALAKGISNFVNNNPGLTKVLATLAAIAATVGPILVMAAGLITASMAVMALSASFGGLAAVTGTLWTLLWPIGLIVVAIGAMVLSFTHLVNKTGSITGAFKHIGATIISALLLPVEGFVKMLHLLLAVAAKIPGVGKYFGMMADGVSSGWNGLAEGIGDWGGSGDRTNGGLGGKAGAQAAGAGLAGKNGTAKMTIDFKNMPKGVEPKMVEGMAELTADNGATLAGM